VLSLVSLTNADNGSFLGLQAYIMYSTKRRGLIREQQESFFVQQQEYNDSDTSYMYQLAPSHNSDVELENGTVPIENVNNSLESST
jgi:hypothetical protein